VKCAKISTRKIYISCIFIQNLAFSQKFCTLFTEKIDWYKSAVFNKTLQSFKRPIFFVHRAANFSLVNRSKILYEMRQKKGNL